MPVRLRTFVAVPMPVTPRLRSARDSLIALGSGLRVTRADQWHVTLKFLGDTDARQLPEIGRVVQRAVTDLPPMEVSLAGIGVFPELRRPRVVWCGISPPDALTAVANRLNEELGARGFPHETRAYRAHLTLAYVKGRPPRELDRWVASRESDEYGLVELDRAVLYQSETGPDGPRYTVLSTHPFGEFATEE